MEDAKRALKETGQMLRLLRESLGFPTLRGKFTGLINQQVIAQQQLQSQPENKHENVQVGGEEMVRGIAPPSQVGQPHQPASPLPKLEAPALLKGRFATGSLLPVRSAVSDFITTMGRTAEIKARAEMEKAEVERKKAEEPKSIHLRRG